MFFLFFFYCLAPPFPFGARCLCAIFQVSRINFSTFPCRRSSLLRLRVKHLCELKPWLVDQSGSSGHRRRAEPRRPVWLGKQCKSATAGHSFDKNKGKGGRSNGSAPSSRKEKVLRLLRVDFTVIFSQNPDKPQ